MAEYNDLPFTPMEILNIQVQNRALIETIEEAFGFSNNKPEVTFNKQIKDLTITPQVPMVSFSLPEIPNSNIQGIEIIYCDKHWYDGYSWGDKDCWGKFLVSIDNDPDVVKDRGDDDAWKIFDSVDKVVDYVGSLMPFRGNSKHIPKEVETSVNRLVEKISSHDLEKDQIDAILTYLQNRFAIELGESATDKTTQN